MRGNAAVRGTRGTRGALLGRVVGKACRARRHPGRRREGVKRCAGRWGRGIQAAGTAGAKAPSHSGRRYVLRRQTPKLRRKCSLPAHALVQCGVAGRRAASCVWVRRLARRLSCGFPIFPGLEDLPGEWADGGTDGPSDSHSRPEVASTTSCYVRLARASHKATPERQGSDRAAAARHRGCTVSEHFRGPASHLCLCVETAPGGSESAKRAEQFREATRMVGRRCQGHGHCRTPDFPLFELEALGGL